MKSILLMISFLLLPVLNAQQEDGYTFDPARVKRDPFKPITEGVSAKNMLTAYDVTRFQLVAILTGIGAAKAMILLPNQETEIVKVGDNFGKNNGKVQKITDSEVVIRETYKDYQGNLRPYFTSLVIAD